jgi:glucokinase
VARQVWSEAVEALADGLTTVSLLFGPALVVIGGGLGRAGDRLLDPLRAALAERARVVASPPLATADHGSRAGVVGAAMLARDGWKAET